MRERPPRLDGKGLEEGDTGTEATTDTDGESRTEGRTETAVGEESSERGAQAGGSKGNEGTGTGRGDGMGGAHTAPWKQDSCQDLGSSLTMSCLSPPGNGGQRNTVTAAPPGQKRPGPEHMQLGKTRGLSGFFNQKMARDRGCEDKMTENVALVWVLLANQLKRDIYES